MGRGMILTLATAAQTSPAATWKAELKRILVTVAITLTAFPLCEQRQ
jgi:hypothetical protein